MDVGTQWDQRFATEEWVYGREPNLWLLAQEPILPCRGQALALGDGEGRNGVWLAARGLEVTAVDASRVGLDKAMRLAGEAGCTGRYRTVHALVETWEWPRAQFDLAVMIYLHMPSALRRMIHRRMVDSLLPGGLLVLECFTPRQLTHRTGGPADPDMLYEPEDLRQDFAGLEILHLEERELALDEGLLHRGTSAVVRLLARRSV